LLVGIATGDDAAVYRISEDMALVQTVDFFPPVVDDPYSYGLISAANSLSDIYATGARPLTALNIVAFPDNLPKDILREILRGGSDKVREAGALIVGGHTIVDDEPKYGLAATGVVRPGEQLTNAGAQPGDMLVLTKPLGSGIITTARKIDEAATDVFDEAVRHMATLNRAASEASVRVGVNACTDVTGFGLVGHLHGMLRSSNASARVLFSQSPIMAGAWELAAERGLSPSGMERNRAYYDEAVSWTPGVHPKAYSILYDPQTSGGLLVSVDAGKVEALIEEMQRSGVESAVIVGEVADGEPGTITVED
jgi:selenide,water dikinase